MKTIDENICLVLHCQETKFLVERGCLFCTEHLTKFDYFLSRYEAPSEIKNMLEIDKEFRNKFLADMVYDFLDKENKEYHRKNKQGVKKRKPKKKSKKRK
ncbi:MAG: hypothetical protein SPLM_10290 [Spiroplasma phoeniceum]|uniref:hypothetical protein n=1 Tax=Spiroplasma phoeniceum TaxID=47835 RepID=UPI003133D922